MEQKKDPWAEMRRERIIIIAGPPGSGKTTFCKQQMRPGDVCLDLDYILAALRLEPASHADHADVLHAGFAVYDGLIDKIADNSLNYGRAFIITTSHYRKIQERTGGSVKILDPGPEETMRRIDADPTTTDVEKQHRKDQALKFYYERSRKGKT